MFSRLNPQRPYSGVESGGSNRTEPNVAQNSDVVSLKLQDSLIKDYFQKSPTTDEETFDAIMKKNTGNGSEFPGKQLFKYLASLLKLEENSSDPTISPSHAHAQEILLLETIRKMLDTDAIQVLTPQEYAAQKAASSKKAPPEYLMKELNEASSIMNVRLKKPSKNPEIKDINIKIKDSQGEKLCLCINAKKLLEFRDYLKEQQHFQPAREVCNDLISSIKTYQDKTKNHQNEFIYDLGANLLSISGLTAGIMTNPPAVVFSTVDIIVKSLNLVARGVGKNRNDNTARDELIASIKKYDKDIIDAGMIALYKLMLANEKTTGKEVAEITDPKKYLTEMGPSAAGPSR